MLTRCGYGNQRGDTLIEVLFAIATFSLVVVSGMLIMNQGSNISQRALEITLVREEMDAQADTLRFLNASYIAAYVPGVTSYTGPAQQWANISNNASTANASDFGNLFQCPTYSKLRKNSFVINTHFALYEPLGSSSYFVPASTFSQVDYDSTSSKFNKAEGIWIEAVKSTTSSGSQANTGYIDFNIRACWDSPGQSVPMTLGTIVRLYEPRG